MPMIRFAFDKYPAFEVTKGSGLMQALLNQSIPVASSCHGEAVCGKCKIKILKGWENLSAIQELEKHLCERLKVPESFRISCQILVMGDIEIDTTYW